MHGTTPLMLRDARITIVGLGLMGGSMAQALHGRCAYVAGVDADPTTVDLAGEIGAVDRATTDLQDGLRGADLIVLACPVRTIISLLEGFRSNPPPARFLIDIGSTKREVLKAMEALPREVDPIGGHPLCGKAISGLRAADPDLYRGRAFILSRLPRTSDSAYRLAGELAQALGAHPVEMAAERHDHLLATTSHLPYLLSATLVGCAERVSGSDEAIWEMTASGFRDTSRLAESDVAMMVDILLTNREEVYTAIGQAWDELRTLADLIDDGEPERLRSALLRVHRRRSVLEPPPKKAEKPHELANLWPGA